MKTNKMSRYSVESNISNIEYKLELLRAEAEQLYEDVLNGRELEFDEEEYTDCFLNLVNEWNGSVYEVHPVSIDDEGIHCVYSMTEDSLPYPISISDLLDVKDVLELINLIVNEK